MPLPVMLTVRRSGADRCAADSEFPRDRLEPGERAVGCQPCRVGDPRFGAVERHAVDS